MMMTREAEAEVQFTEAKYIHTYIHKRRKKKDYNCQAVLERTPKLVVMPSIW